MPDSTLLLPSGAPRSLRLRRLAYAVLLLGLGWLTAVPAVAKEKAQPALDEQGRALALESFDYVWQTIHDKHWDLSSIDWDGARSELRAEMEQAKSSAQVTRVLNELISRLGMSHFVIIDSEAYQEMSGLSGEGDDGDRPSSGGDAGFDLRVHDGKALVTRVRPGSPAFEAGVRPGFELIKADDRTIDDLLERIDRGYAGTPMYECAASSAAQATVARAAGDTARAVFRDARGKKRKIEIQSTRPTGTPAKFGYLPTMYTEFDSRELGDAGYIRFNVFMDPPKVMKAYGDAIKEFSGKDGIVIDLRGNPGGIAGMAMGMGGWLVQEKGLHLGTMITKDTTLRLVLNPRLGSYEGPVAVLVDGCSMSSSEFMAGGLQSLGRARVFGTPTPGAALPSVIEKLPTGQGFQYAIANYVAADGNPLEGVGVQPDETVIPDRERLLDGGDPILEAALDWIESEARRKGSVEDDSTP
ncbi:hypothetical protein ABI59_07055 [Acidobacteria bacterium Mor1]|nr:hypothetical protein ABI59_07055 [Acidobacteria bacterium Mor1]